MNETNPNDSVNVTFSHEIYDGIGLTKREFFAALAMPGLIASSGGVFYPSALANNAVICADALTQKLNLTRSGAVRAKFTCVNNDRYPGTSTSKIVFVLSAPLSGEESDNSESEPISQVVVIEVSGSVSDQDFRKGQEFYIEFTPVCNPNPD